MPLDTTMFDRYYADLAAIYRRAQRELQRAISSAASTAFARRRAELLKQQVDSIVKALEAGQKGWAARAIPQSYRKGIELAREAYKLPVLPYLSVVDRRSIEAIAERIAADTADALHSVAPFAQRLWIDARQAIVREEQLAREIAAGRVTGLGPKELGKRIAQTLKDGAGERLAGYLPDELRERIERTARGELISIYCKDGKWRNYDLEAYSEMVASSGTRMAATEATLMASAEVDGDLVQWSVHDGACEECEQLQGGVFSISGSNPDFPVLEDDEKPPLHPHCGHVLTGVDEAFLRDRGLYGTLSDFSTGDQTAGSVADYEEMLTA